MSEELEINLNDNDQVVIKHASFEAVMTAEEAETLAGALLRQAAYSAKRRRAKIDDAKRAAAEAIPVDYSARTLTDGSPVTEDHREIIQDGPLAGQQKGYVVLSAEERAKGFVRPVRRSYIHKTCGTETTAGLALAESIARCPTFYSGTFCCGCRTHFDVDQFVWSNTDIQVGS